MTGGTHIAPIAILGALSLAAPQSVAQSWFQPWLGIDADMTAAQCTQPVGGRCALVCPASDGQRGNVEGTDIYSNYSSVCAAAIHASVLAPGQAGAVVIVIGAGEKSYRGSVRNRITSHDRGPRAGSFTFATDGAPGTISWQTAWSRIPASFTDRVTVTCPEGGDPSGKAWGTDVYTVDSSICVAAVHTGVITAKGGAVTVQRAQGLKQYTGSERFGIASRGAGANADAFAVTGVTESTSGRRAGSSVSAVAPRTIQLAGFTAAGHASGGAARVAPRTIQLAGFTASGSSPPGRASNVAPRTITTGGWTASGSGTTP
ncbi:MAG: LCCL domain-containing protein [Steroidobacteraceae bacterium]